MRFEAASSPEQNEDELVRRAADEVKTFAKKYRWPDSVYRALDAVGVKDRAEQRSYFSKVASELKRRKRIERLSKDAAGGEAAKYEAEEREREDGEA